MNKSARFLWLLAGILLGIVGVWGNQQPKPALASNDRHEDYIMTTGPVRLGVNGEADAIWILDYKAGKLLGSIIDRQLGKVMSWANVDLVQEFEIPPRQNVHFLMTTGSSIKGQSALYLTEINSGKFGIYTIGPVLDGKGGTLIRRHDRSMFRQPAPQ